MGKNYLPTSTGERRISAINSMVSPNLTIARFSISPFTTPGEASRFQPRFQEGHLKEDPPATLKTTNFENN